MHEAALDALASVAIFCGVISRVRRALPTAESFRRFLAVGGVALVLLLALFAATPELHRALHAGHEMGDSDDCAVVLFAQGVTSPCDTAILAAIPAEWSVFTRPVAVEVFIASPRYLHVPGRGPPLI